MKVFKNLNATSWAAKSFLSHSHGYFQQRFHILFRSSRSEMFFKIDVLKSFGIFTGKQLCWSLFLIKLQALYPYTPLEPFSWLRASCESLLLPWKDLHSVYANWYKLKGGTLDKSFTILESGQITVQFHTPTTTFSYLV